MASSSNSPNALYGWFGAAPPTTGLPGYMFDTDVGTTTQDFTIRAHDVPVTATTPTGRLLGTTTAGFTNLGDSDNNLYTFAPSTEYTGSLTIERINATEMTVTAKLGDASFSVTDGFDSANFGMLAFWVNSLTFGQNSTAGQTDNGIDFSNVTIEVVPEPASLSLLALGLGWMIARRRRA